MYKQKKTWFQHWFNQDYLNLYSSRNENEASKQIDFLIQALNLHGNEKVLDLGCGTGRHAIELGKRGFECMGLDLSAFLIEEGKKELQKFSLPHVSLIAGDMFTFKINHSFDVILNLFTSFGYSEEDSDNARLFKVVRSHLKPEGKFFLDYLHPAQVRRDLKPYEELLINEEKVMIFKTIEKNQVVKKIEFSNPVRSYEEKVKLYERKEIEAMLASHGLRIIEAWNDYEGNPWKPLGDRQLFYCVSELFFS